MENNFKDFRDIEHTPLRVYNRTVLLFNLISDFGRAVGEKYLESMNLSPGERAQIGLMITYIEQHGTEAALKAATKDLVIVDEPE